MKKIVRFTAFFVGALLLLALAGYIFLSVRQSNSGKQLIHPRSESILRVHVDKILKELLSNAIANPREYWGTSTDTIKRMRVWEAGIAIPANLYLFSLPEDTLTWYAMLKVKDKGKFQRYLTQQMDAGIEDTEDFLWYATTEKGRFAVMGNEDRAVVSYSLKNREKIVRLREMLLNADEFIAIESMDMPAVSNSKSPITYWNSKTQNTGYVDFSLGRIDLKGDFSTPLWRLSDAHVGRTMPSDNILSVWLDADIRETIAQHGEFFSRLNVDIDSLLPYVGNYWEVQLKQGDVLQQDTIVTYDYDDNFEMSEKQEIRSESVPNLSFSLKASPHLLSYLPEKAFYRFYKHVDQGIVTLTTDSVGSVSPQSSQVEGHESTSFYLAYHRSDGTHVLQSHFPKLEVLERGEVKGIRQDEHKLVYEGYLLFEKSYIHPLKQIFE